MSIGVHPNYVRLVEGLLSAAQTRGENSASVYGNVVVLVKGRRWGVLYEREEGDRVMLGKGESFIGDHENALMSACQHAGQLAYQLP
jgi:hypothetical protein